MNFYRLFDFEWHCIHAILRSRVFVKVVMWFFNENILLCFCCNHCSINSWESFWYFVVQMLEVESKSIEIIVFEWFFDDSSIEYMNVSTNCANFFNRFVVFDSSLLLWIVKNLKWMTFVVKNVREIAWLKLFV